MEVSEFLRRVAAEQGGKHSQNIIGKECSSEGPARPEAPVRGCYRDELTVLATEKDRHC